MKKSKLLILSLSALLSLGAIVSCGNSESSEQGPSSSEKVEEKTVSKIEVVTNPTKVNYEEGESLDLTGLKVEVVYSDGTREDVTSSCTASLGDKALTAANKNFYVVYKYEEAGKNKTKTALVEITVKAEEVIKPTLEKDLVATPDMFPHNAVKTAEADMVFYGYYDSTSMKNEFLVELTKTDDTKGTFKFTELNGIANGSEKIGIITGDYVIEGEKMTLQSRLAKITSNTAKYDSATKEVATIVKENGEIVGLNFGAMNGDNKFWGWSKSKASAFVESLATLHGGQATEAYAHIVKDKQLTSDMKSYYVVDKMVLAESSTLNTTYFVGDTFNLTGAEVVVDYAVPEGSSDSAMLGLVVSSNLTTDKTEPLTLEDTTAKIYYDGGYVEVPLTVNPLPVERSIKAIEVATQPTKTSYKPGEVFDTTGMVVNAVYTDNTKEVITNYTYKTDALVGTDTKVEIKYDNEGTELIAEVPVTVAFVEPWVVATSSDADYVFAQAATISNKKQQYATIELDGDLTTGGKFVTTIRFTTQSWTKGNNYFVYTGTYVVDGKTVKFTPTFVDTDKATTSMYYNTLAGQALKEGHSFNATLAEDSSTLTFALDRDANSVIISESTEYNGNPFFGVNGLSNAGAQVVLEVVANKTLSESQNSGIPAALK